MAHRTMQNKSMRVSYRDGTVDGEHIFENHCHTRYEMIAVFEGEMTIVIDGKRYTERAGDIVMIPPLAYHSVFAVGDTAYKRVTILFDGEVIPQEIADEFISKIKESAVLSRNPDARAVRMLEGIFSEERIEKFLPLAASILTEIMYTYIALGAEGAAHSVDPTVEAIMAYIDDHIDEKILLDDIAASLFLSKSTVCHVFSSEMKISPKQYILQKKLAYASGLIEDGASAAEASRAIGYENYANFYKAFVKTFGESPKGKKS